MGRLGKAYIEKSVDTYIEEGTEYKEIKGRFWGNKSVASPYRREKKIFNHDKMNNNFKEYFRNAPIGLTNGQETLRIESADSD